MLRFFALGFGAFLAWGIYSQASMPNGSGLLLALGFVLALVFAYFAGRARRPSAVAVAQATAVAVAEAKAQQAVVLNVNLGARNLASETYAGLDELEWVGPPLPVSDASVLADGLDPDELWEVSGAEREPTP